LSGVNAKTSQSFPTDLLISLRNLTVGVSYSVSGAKLKWLIPGAERRLTYTIDHRCL